MGSVLFAHIGSLVLLSIAVIGTTAIVGNSNQVWAEVFEGTEGTDVIIGTTEDDIIDSKGGDDFNSGDAVIGDGLGDDVIVSGDGGGSNTGDSSEGDGFGDDVIVSGEGDDQSTGNGGADIFACGEGQDTITDYNEAEGDIAAPDCENV